MSALLSAALIVATTGSLSVQDGVRPTLDTPDLELLHFVSWASTYAPYQYACEKLSPKQMERKAKSALGRNYQARIERVISDLSSKYGNSAVEEATIYVTPGYIMGPEVCRRFAHVVPDALASLKELERRIGDKR